MENWLLDLKSSYTSAICMFFSLGVRINGYFYINYLRYGQNYILQIFKDPCIAQRCPIYIWNPLYLYFQDIERTSYDFH